MKRILAPLLLLAALAASSTSASAQYYELANQLGNIIRPALSGSFAYRGTVELSGIAGVGYDRINTLEITTVQGFKYADWFFMGAGLGIDLAIGGDGAIDGWNHTVKQYKAMMPLFSDFRFNIGGESKPSFFVDLRLGAAWFFGDNYLDTRHNYIDNGTYFYLKPGIGVRFPLNKENPTRAFNVALTYQLLTNSGSGGYFYRDRSVAMSGFGVTLGYEW